MMYVPVKRLSCFLPNRVLRRAMGKLDLFAKQTLAAYVKPITQGGATWKDPPEIPFERIQSDAIVVVHDPSLLVHLPAPWRLVKEPDEILVDYKMQGDHVDDVEVSRILLRRQARELQRILEVKQSRREGVAGQNDKPTPAQRAEKMRKVRQTIWVISAYVPRWARDEYRPVELAPGCHKWASEPHFLGLWIAANELPLHPANWPFLIARTGRFLQELLDWARTNMRLPALREMVTSLLMMNLTVDDIIDAAGKGEAAGRAYWAKFVNEWPELRDQITKEAVEEAALAEARKAVLEVFRARGLETQPKHLARIEACTDVATLHKWLRHAITAASVDDVFR